MFSTGNTAEIQPFYLSKKLWVHFREKLLELVARLCDRRPMS
jgi:hypothetical protein